MFDFTGFKAAFVQKDLERWLGYYADDAQWLEYKPIAPPRAPIVMDGKRAIRAFLEGVERAPIDFEITDEVVGPERAAFCVKADLGGGRRVIEHVIVHYSDGQITRQVDVEAWD